MPFGKLTTVVKVIKATTANPVKLYLMVTPLVQCKEGYIILNFKAGAIQRQGLVEEIFHRKSELSQNYILCHVSHYHATFSEYFQCFFGPTYVG